MNPRVNRLHDSSLAGWGAPADAGSLMSKLESIEEPPWRAGLRGARALARPGLALQFVALLLVLAYYHHASVRHAVDELAQLHERAGVWFGVVSTGVFGGLVPFLYLRSRRATRDRFTWAGGGVLTAFWAYKGIEVDLWYRLLARLVGEAHTVRTVVTKMILDQFVYCPILAVPVTVVVYAWIETHFAAAPVVADLHGGRWYRRRVLPVLISNLGVWVPAVCIIYALPTPLQLPLQNLVLCFFTLLLAHVMPKRRGHATTET